MGDISLVACVDLLVGIGYRCRGIGRIFQLENTERYTIDEKQNIGDTDIATLTIAHFKLVDHSKAVAPHLVKVYASNIDSQTIALPRVAVALNEEAIGGAQLGKVRLPTRVAEVVDDVGYIFALQLGVLLLEEATEVVHQEHLSIRAV